MDGLHSEIIGARERKSASCHLQCNEFVSWKSFL